VTGSQKAVSRRSILAGTAGLIAAGLTACGPAKTSRDLADVTLTVWRYKNTAGNFMKEAGQADTPYTVRYADLPGGPPVLNAYAAGAIDYAFMSQIPPILAMQSNIPLKLFATFTGDVNNSGVLVRPGSSVRRFEALRGRTIAYTPSTNDHYYLLKLLDAHGMALSDVEAVGLPSSDASAAFSRGHVEARVCGGLTALLTEIELGGRWISNTVAGLYSGNFCLSAHPDALADPLKHAAIVDYARREQATWAWIYRNPQAWARRSSELSSLPATLFERLAREQSRPGLIIAPDEAAIQDQQAVANYLNEHGLVKQRFDIAPIWENDVLQNLK
jgi:sulfonate transport system substrate-binding protein